MKKVLLILLCFFSQQLLGQTKPLLYVQTSTTIDTVTTSTTRVVSDKYFEISITSVTKNGSKHFISRKEIERHAQPFKMVDDFIVDKNNEILRFKDASEFLNYMDARGYEVKFEKPNKYGASYTFVRKN